MEYKSDALIVVCPVCRYQYQHARSKRSGNCPNCAHIERHGESIFEKKKRKHLESMKRMYERAEQKAKNAPVKKKAVIPNFSAKGLEQAKKVKAAKQRLRNESIDGAFYECQGCKRYFKNVDGSHKIPLSQSTKHAAEEDNITLLCRDCHNKWENGTVMQMITLKCFVSDMEYLYIHDKPRFHKIFFRMLDEYEQNESPALEKAISKLESFHEDDEQNDEL